MSQTKQQQYVCKRDGATIHVFVGYNDFGRGKSELTRADVYSAGEPIRGELPPTFLERLEAGDEHANSLVALVDVEASEDAQAEVQEATSAAQERAAGQFDPLSANLLELKDYMATASPDERERVGQILEDAGILEGFEDDDEEEPLPPPVPVPPEFQGDGDQGGSQTEPNGSDDNGPGGDGDSPADPQNPDGGTSTEEQPPGALAVDQVAGDQPAGDGQGDVPAPEDDVDPALLEPTDYNSLKQPDLKVRLDARKVEYPKGAVSNATLIELLEADDQKRAAASQEGEQTTS